MSMVINTNVASLASQRHLASSRADMEQAMERLSSGKRINSAGDDAAGLSISHSLDSKIAGLNQAVRNANDGVAMINLAEGAMEQISSMLTRMKELATQAANGTYTSDQLTNLNSEFTALASEITRVAEGTDFNGTAVLDSTSSIAFQVGDGSSTTQDQISVTLQAMTADAIGSDGGEESVADTATTSVVSDAAVANSATTVTLSSALVTSDYQLSLTYTNADGDASTVTASFDTDIATTLANLKDEITDIASGDLDFNTTDNEGYITLEFAANTVEADATLTIAAYAVESADATYIDEAVITSASEALAALDQIDQAIIDVDSYRSDLGAVANRLDHAAANLMSRVEHQSAARSRIEDADYAVESANLAKAQVLQQAGTAMLSQANASTQNVLSLLK